MRLFKKLQPKVNITLANGASLQFENIDNLVGIYGTEDPGLLGEIDAMMKRGSGGIDEIGYEEYAALKQKKKTGSQSSRPWREEFSKVGVENSKSKHPFEIPVAMVSDEQAVVRAVGSVVPSVETHAGPAVRPTATKR